MRNDNQILFDSKAFALRIIRLYNYLKQEKQVYVLSKQLLRSGTSIGANVRESVNAQSRMDFINKLNIALKEANESEYWLELLIESGYYDNNDILEKMYRYFFLYIIRKEKYTLFCVFLLQKAQYVV